MSALLEVEGLTKAFPARGTLSWRARPAATVPAVSNVTFSVGAGETLAIVGESGSGKSTVARCIVRLLEPTSGRVLFDGRDITAVHGRDMVSLRREMSLIFQDPYSSLDPRQRIGDIIGEPLRIHGLADRHDVRRQVTELLDIVGLQPAHYNRFPHQFSGGQRQRVGIARALAAKPKLVVCDEPVSALDVSIQAQILNLLKDLQSEYGLTYVFISHDLGVVNYMADRVLVMYQGRVVEQASRARLFSAPQHPYTAELLAAVPVPDPDLRDVLLRSAPADDRSSAPSPTGCAFAPSCPRARPSPCHSEAPPLRADADGAEVACHFPLNGDASSPADDRARS